MIARLISLMILSTMMALIATVNTTMRVPLCPFQQPPSSQTHLLAQSHHHHHHTHPCLPIPVITTITHTPACPFQSSASSHTHLLAHSSHHHHNKHTCLPIPVITIITNTSSNYPLRGSMTSIATPPLLWQSVFDCSFWLLYPTHHIPLCLFFFHFPPPIQRRCSLLGGDGVASPSFPPFPPLRRLSSPNFHFVCKVEGNRRSLDLPNCGWSGWWEE